MKYTKISVDLREFVKKATYEDMSEKGQELYIKYAKKLSRKIKKLENDESDISEELAKTELQDHYREIVFMGMSFHGNHRFSADDTVKLLRDNSDPFNPGAVKVMLKNRKGWKKVAFLADVDAAFVRNIPNFERSPLKFESSSSILATYLIWMD